MKKPSYTENTIFQILMAVEAGTLVPALCRIHSLSCASLYKSGSKLAGWRSRAWSAPIAGRRESPNEEDVR